MKPLPGLSAWILVSALCASVSAAPISLEQAHTDGLGAGGAVSSGGDGVVDAGSASEMGGKVNTARAPGGATLVTTSIGTSWVGGVPPKLLVPSTGAAPVVTTAVPTGTSDAGGTPSSTELGAAVADNTQLVPIVVAGSEIPQGALTTSTLTGGALTGMSHGQPIVEIAKVSEPSVLALLGLGALGLTLLRRRA